MFKGRETDMKNLWLDILLVFLIWQGGVYIYENTTPESILYEELKTFNDDIKNERVLKDYHIKKETEQSNLSEFINEASNLSRKTISIFVDLTMGILSGFN